MDSKIKNDGGLMKLLIFSYVFKPESFLVNELAESLSHKISISVCTGLPNYPKGDFFEGYSLSGPFYEKFGNVEVYRYPMIPRKKGFLSLTLNYLSHLFFSLLKICQLPRSDVYFVFATSPLLIAIPAVILKKIRKRPLVIWYQDLWPESFIAVTKTSPNSLLVKFLKIVTRWIYKNTDLMMIQSEAFRKSLDQYNYKGKTVYVPNWCPETTPTSETPKWLQDLNTEDSTLISFAGNIGKAQALDSLLEVAYQTQNQKVIYLFVGDGSDKARLEQRAAELKLSNVRFTGRKPLEDMPALFEQSDYLYASLAKDELFALTLPSKVQSYMAAGKPLIVSLNGEGRRIVEEAQCGLSAPAESTEELILAVEKALKLSQVEREELGQNARNYYLKHFDKAQVLSVIEKELKDLA
ncbi:MAG: glycosyltransferase family 4 protein [Bdellovibrionota bacterium]